MNDTAESRLKRTLFCVEANSFEIMTLWQQHASDSNHVAHFNYGKPLKWEQMDGWSVKVGQVGERPVSVTMTWNKLDGCLVMFYEPTSLIVDYVQIEEWLAKHFNGTYDNGTRRAYCDAMNFGHCLNAIKEHNKNQYK